MSLSVTTSNISRQQLYDTYLQSPESAPLKIPDLTYTTLAKDYRFEDLLARFSSPTAGGLVDEATRDAENIKQGSAPLLTKGFVCLVLGMASLVSAAWFLPLIIVALIGLRYGVTWISDGNIRLRQANYDTRFAADVIRYAGQVAAAGGENEIWQQEA